MVILGALLYQYRIMHERSGIYVGPFSSFLVKWKTRNNVLEEGDKVKKSIEELSKGLDEVKKTTLALAEKVDKLNKSLADLSREVGKLSDSFGFIVEDVARSLLPTWLHVNMGILVKNLSRAFFDLGNKVVEVDFYGEGVDVNGDSVVVFGEAKARIHGEDVKAFYDKVQQVLRQKSRSKYTLLMYGLYVHPSAVQEALQREIVVVSPYTVVSRYSANRTSRAP
ncbi:MAG: hypothetical protein QXJ26_07070 [Desulfurococcaceae archaeon]